MRKKIVAGNWKMNKTLSEGVVLAQEVLEQVRMSKEMEGVEVIVAPPFIHLAQVAEVFAGSAVQVAAQNCGDEKVGAYTGEVSADMVASTGAQYVILGHSERRGYYGETNEMLVKKMKQALASGLKIIFCVGEDLGDRESLLHYYVVKKQLDGAVFQLTPEEFSHVVVAYEPVWAIGTGKTATPEVAQKMHQVIRLEISERYGQAVADVTPILYGGSCNAKNADEIFSQPDVDGGLIGGASLKAADFAEIIKARARH